MDLGRDSIGIIILGTFMVSCSSPQKATKANYGVIFVQSVLSNEVCNLNINDSVYFENRKIVTDVSLGYDRNNWIELRNIKNPLSIRITATGDVMEGDKTLGPVMREVALDTIYDLRKGKYLVVIIDINEISLGHSNKPITLN